MGLRIQMTSVSVQSTENPWRMAVKILSTLYTSCAEWVKVANGAKLVRSRSLLEPLQHNIAPHHLLVRLLLPTKVRRRVYRARGSSNVHPKSRDILPVEPIVQPLVNCAWYEGVVRGLRGRCARLLWTKLNTHPLPSSLTDQQGTAVGGPVHGKHILQKGSAPLNEDHSYI